MGTFKLCILSAAMLTVLAFGGVVVDFPEKTVYSGTDVVEIPISIENSGEMVGIQFTLLYDEEIISAIEVSKGEVIYDWYHVVNFEERNKLTIAGVNFSLQPTELKSGELFLIKFKVLKNTNCFTVVAFDNVFVVDENGNMINAQFNNGLVSIEQPFYSRFTRNIMRRIKRFKK
jgi:hypothetical protein